MKYVVVDIETTGGRARQNGITEVAAVLTDGKEILDSFQTLVRPHENVPPFISEMTGITNEMLVDAPLFVDISDELFQFLEGKVFVAHNVSFDYNFIRNHFKAAGIDYQSKRLCTVKMSRKIFPGLASYSLGKLCRHFDITNEARHRAMGDAHATTLLFHKLLQVDHSAVIEKMLKNKEGELKLPPNIVRRQFNKLPNATGVYYFHNKKGKVIYVGKAINIKKRIIQHFTNGFVKRNLLGLMSQIYDISFEVTGSELAALLLESFEIKRHWPAYNRAQKYTIRQYAVIHFTDGKGYKHLAIDRQHGADYEIKSFPNPVEARQLLKRLMAAYALCEKYCGLIKTIGPCSRYHNALCSGACIGNESSRKYNKRVDAAIQSLRAASDSFLVMDRGRNEDEQTIVAVENGVYLGFGYADKNQCFESAEELKSLIKAFPNHPEARNIIYSFLPKLPANRLIYLEPSNH